MAVLAVVPARGGSKGIPGKNLVEVCGRPLVAWSVAAGLAASTVDRVVVSTDDADIAAAGRAAGAEVPFLRPESLAGDLVADLPVFQHVLERLAADEGYEPDLVVQLRPTSPVRPAGLIDDGVGRLAGEPSADSLRAVCPAPSTPYKMWRIDDGWLDPLLGTVDDELFNRPRQTLPPVHWQIGTLDVIRAPVIRAGSMSGRRILALEVDASLAVDIDRPEDIERAARALAGAGLV